MANGFMPELNDDFYAVISQVRKRMFGLCDMVNCSKECAYRIKVMKNELISYIKDCVERKRIKPYNYESDSLNDFCETATFVFLFQRYQRRFFAELSIAEYQDKIIELTEFKDALPRILQVVEPSILLYACCKVFSQGLIGKLSHNPWLWPVMPETKHLVKDLRFNGDGDDLKSLSDNFSYMMASTFTCYTPDGFFWSEIDEFSPFVTRTFFTTIFGGDSYCSDNPNLCVVKFLDLYHSVR